MSTNSECMFYHVAKEGGGSEWFYLLEDYHAPKNAWDWREYATAYGPFATLYRAIAHLRDNHANPGGYGIDPEGAPRDPGALDDVLREHFADARKRGTQRMW